MIPPDDREAAVARFLEGPELLEQAVAGLDDSDLDTIPNKGGWTIRQIVHHVVDGDDLWKTGIKLALGGQEAEFSLDWYRSQPQDDWARRWAYADRPIDVSLALLRVVRAHILQLVEQVPDSWTRSVLFRDADGSFEEVPVGFVVQMQADHVEHHVKRILSIRREIGKDLFNLTRFVEAQETVFDSALSEIRAGRKQTHWMWFIFPQLRGLGQSHTSQIYGISGLGEARAYLWHEVLGPRLITICEAVLAVAGKSATDIFGKPDDIKLRSSATLFARVSGPDSVFREVLDKYFDGEPDPKTLQLLDNSRQG